LGYHYLGEQEVKNIPEPVRVYRLLTEPEDVDKIIAEEKPKGRKLRVAALGALALVIFVTGTLRRWPILYRKNLP
jgi:hypothetical protein